MILIRDPWYIRDAMVNGYPLETGNDGYDEELNTGDCPALPSWLWDNERKED